MQRAVRTDNNTVAREENKASLHVETRSYCIVDAPRERYIGLGTRCAKEDMPVIRVVTKSA